MFFIGFLNKNDLDKLIWYSNLDPGCNMAIWTNNDIVDKMQCKTWKVNGSIDANDAIGSPHHSMLRKNIAAA